MLHSCDASVCKFADESVNAYLNASRSCGVPMVAVLVLSEKSVIGADIPFQPGIICTCGVYHDALGCYLFACFVAVIICKKQFLEIHVCYAVLSLKTTRSFLGVLYVRACLLSESPAVVGALIAFQTDTITATMTTGLPAA